MLPRHYEVLPVPNLFRESNLYTVQSEVKSSRPVLPFCIRRDCFVPTHDACCLLFCPSAFKVPHWWTTADKQVHLTDESCF
jgi:hypothetical protein